MLGMLFLMLCVIGFFAIFGTILKLLGLTFIRYVLPLIGVLILVALIAAAVAN